jgi:hypothetical protein
LTNGLQLYGVALAGVRFPTGAGNFSFRHRIQTGPEAHPASYSVGTGVLSLGVKRLGREADHSLPSSAEVKESVRLYLQSPNTPSWRGAQKEHRDKFTFYFTFIPLGHFLSLSSIFAVHTLVDSIAKDIQK